MNKKIVSTILLICFIVVMLFTAANVFLDDSYTLENQTGTLMIDNETRHYEKVGKCLDIIDGNTIQVYGVGKVQLTQIASPNNEAKDFVISSCLGKTVYLDIDDKQPKDRYGRTLAIVYTNTTDINKALLDNNFAKQSYFTPSEFEKGKV